MERDIKGLGLVLRTEDVGERDRMLTVFGPSIGMIHCRIYGGQKSVKAPRVPLFAEGNFSLYHVPEKNQWSLRDSDIIAERHEIREDIDRTVAASLFAELVITGRSDDPYLYELITSALDHLTVGDDFRRVTTAFIMKYLSFFGTLPGFDICPVCQKVYQQDEILGYNDMESAPSCQKCDTASGSMLLPPNARRFLTRTLEVGFADSLSFRVSDAQTERIFRYSLRLLERSYPVRLRSLSSGLWTTV